MARRRTSKFTWGVLVLMVATVGLSAWGLFVPHVEEPSGPVSASRAESFASIPIPTGATNIRIAGFRHWISYVQYVRFESPVAVCLEVAGKVVPGQKLEAVDSFELASSSRVVRPDVFRDIGWFDLAKATNVVSAGGGPGDPRVWVDRDRGVFYFRRTD